MVTIFHVNLDLHGQLYVMFLFFAKCTMEQTVSYMQNSYPIFNLIHINRIRTINDAYYLRSSNQGPSICTQGRVQIHHDQNATLGPRQNGRHSADDIFHD